MVVYQGPSASIPAMPAKTLVPCKASKGIGHNTSEDKVETWEHTEGYMDPEEASNYNWTGPPMQGLRSLAREAGLGLGNLFVESWKYTCQQGGVSYQMTVRKTKGAAPGARPRTLVSVQGIEGLASECFYTYVSIPMFPYLSCRQERKMRPTTARWPLFS